MYNCYKLLYFYYIVVIVVILASTEVFEKLSTANAQYQEVQQQQY